MIRLIFGFGYLTLFSLAAFYLHRLAERQFLALDRLNGRVSQVSDKVETLRTEIVIGTQLQPEEDAEFMAIMHANGFNR